MVKRLFLLAIAAFILVAVPGPARAGDARRPLAQNGDVYLYLPMVIKPAPPAALEIDNQTGADVRVDIHGVGSHVFPPGTSVWSNINVDTGWYDFTATSLGGACNGQSLTGRYWLERGETTRDGFNCS